MIARTPRHVAGGCWCWASPFIVAAQSAVPRYEVKRVSAPLTIDGKLDEAGVGGGAGGDAAVPVGVADRREADDARPPAVGRAGLPFKTVPRSQELAGHADLSTTQRYTHLTAATEDAIRLLDGRRTDADLAEKVWRHFGHEIGADWK